MKNQRTCFLNLKLPLFKVDSCIEIKQPSRVFRRLPAIPFFIEIFSDERMYITLFIVGLLVNRLKRQFACTAIAL